MGIKNNWNCQILTEIAKNQPKEKISGLILITILKTASS